MKVLVIGGCGYVGGVVVDTLKQFEHIVHVYDKLLYEDRYLKPIPFIYGDIQDYRKICELHQKEKYNVVIILAALVGDAACNLNPSLTEKVNYKAISNLCKQLPKDVHLVWTSTCSVYGANEKVVDETSKPNPLSCYASTKLKAEKPMLDRGATVFRLGTVYGTGDNYSRIRADLVVNTLTIKAFTEKEITVNGGNQFRPIISVRDIAGYIQEACERGKEVSGLYNIAYENVQISELADDILEVLPDIKVNKVDQMFQDDRNYQVSTLKAEKTFTYKPHFTVQEEVLRLYNLLKDGRIKDPSNINYVNGLFLAQRRL